MFDLEKHAKRYYYLHGYSYGGAVYLYAVSYPFWLSSLDLTLSFDCTVLPSTVLISRVFNYILFLIQTYLN